MTLTSEELTAIQVAITLGVPVDDLDLDDEGRSAYATLADEVAAAPGGSYADPPFEWPDDRWDEAIEREYAAFGEPSDTSISAPLTLISKAVVERRFTLGPMYVPDSLDAHGEWTDADELQKAVWDYVRKGDRRIRLQHDRSVVAGEALEIMAWPYPTEVPMMTKDAGSRIVTFPANTVFLGVQWEPWAWEMVKADKLRGYSIGGRAERLLVDLGQGGQVAKADDVAAPEPPTRPTDSVGSDVAAAIGAAIADAMKSHTPTVNIVMPEERPRVRRVERDEQGNITGIVEE